MSSLYTRKRILTYLLCLLIILTITIIFSACGGDKPEITDTDTDTTPVTESAPDTTSEKPPFVLIPDGTESHKVTEPESDNQNTPVVTTPGTTEPEVSGATPSSDTTVGSGDAVTTPESGESTSAITGDGWTKDYL